jgi:hypothetical protein
VLQIPFVQLSKAPVLKIHDADRGRQTQGLNFGSRFGDWPWFAKVRSDRRPKKRVTVRSSRAHCIKFLARRRVKC